MQFGTDGANQITMKEHQSKKFNSALTNRVISLHQQGYTDDFLPLDKEKVKCIQNGESFALQHLQIQLIDCSYDLLTHTYQYVHTIDTYMGYRGLLITNGILPLTN